MRITAAADRAWQATVLAWPDAEGRLRPVWMSLPLPSGLRRELAPLSGLLVGTTKKWRRRAASD
ncbi:hypothetical protein [Kitasatospora sp. NBC_01300]|uniref:hypothetical protein n=1 Tax=Kitasatospora sp. NBC_01300 TaxID=2903574 RepID=UPI002F91BAAB|nr:hypothetical protein OG556_33855 [Kitasatospora sp. NBC_01300]